MTLLLALLCAAVLGACGPADGDRSDASGSENGTPAAGIELVDDHGDTLALSAPARRVISLVPAMTEAVHRFGASDRLVARTDYDTLAALADLPSVGGGLGPNLEVIRTLDPDVVVSFAGESDPRTSAGLRSFDIAEFAVRPDGIDDVPRIITQLGRLTGRESGADSLVGQIRADLQAVRGAVAQLSPVEAAYLLGGSPPLAAGPGTFLSELLELGGGRNMLSDLPELYAPVSPEALRSRGIRVILVSEGTRLDSRIADAVRVATVPNWVELPGPRLGEAAWVVARALHPGLPGGPP